MYRFLRIGALALLLLVTSSPVYAERDVEADKVVEGFLKATKIIDMPEGKEMLLEYTWDASKLRLPTLIDSEELYAGYFETDQPDVRGYKQMLEVKVSSRAGTELSKKYIAILYRDTSSGNWKVFDFRSGDFDYEVAAVEKELENPAPFPKVQVHHRRHAYWLTMAGKPLAAKEALLQAKDINEKDPVKDAAKFTASVEKSLEILEKILQGN